MLDFILKIDYALFYFFNQVLTHPVLDAVLPFLRIPLFWVPCYVFIFLWAILNLQRNKAMLWLFLFICVVSFCDSISSHIIKVLIYRPRPCVDPLWYGKVRHLVSYCSLKSSFTSSHATNHFGISVYLILTLKEYINKKWKYIILLWAVVVSYAQVYVGLHYPIDVLCGGLLGATIAYFISNYFIKTTDTNKLFGSIQ